MIGDIVSETNKEHIFFWNNANSPIEIDCFYFFYDNKFSD